MPTQTTILDHDYISPDVDKREVTKLIALLAEALEKDYKTQQDKDGLRKSRFSLSEFNRLIHKAYGLSNRQAFTYGKSIGKKIINDQKLNSTDSLIKPIDLQSICLYVLKNQGSLGWPEFTKVLAGASVEFKGLLSISAANPADLVQEVRDARVDYVINPKRPLAHQLRELADTLDPLEAKIEQMRQHSLNLAQANAKLANRNQQLEESINRVKQAIKRLEEGAKNETNHGKRRQMQQMIELFKQKVSDLLH